ncbi:MAG: uracil-xanthine permease family protein [Candidatus Methanofastidiosia archaeon]
MAEEGGKLHYFSPDDVAKMSIEELAKQRVIYGIEDKPPLGESILLGIQHYLTMFGATFIIPILVASAVGFDGVETAQLVSLMFFVSGITTILQTTWGNKLPIVQGGTFSFLPPMFVITGTVIANGGSSHLAMQELTGAIIAASFFEIIIGFSGLMGELRRILGPITVAPTIALIGLSLYGLGMSWLMQDWRIGMVTLISMIIYSQFLRAKNKIFLMFPVLLAIITGYAFAWILTLGGVVSSGDAGYVSTQILKDSPWIAVPKPFMWGTPKFTTSFIIGMIAGYVASMIESVGDYMAAARLSGAHTPTRKVISRGIGMEGVGCLIAGIFGTGNGTTSYSENIGAIGLTKVGSRYVIQVAAVVMMILGVLGKFGGFFAGMPTAVVGAMYCALFGMIAAVGISNLQFVDLNSSRNLFIVGFAMFMGLSVPVWANTVTIDPSLSLWLRTLEDVLLTLAKTGMAVAAICAGLLDNTVPGTKEERGLLKWHAEEG